VDGLLVDDGREALRLRGRLGDAVDHEPLGDRLDAVHDVVEPRHQRVDVVPVEGGE
jgi:hypothetical protein